MLQVAEPCHLCVGFHFGGRDTENCRMDISVNETVSLPVDFLELIVFLMGT